MKRILRLLCLIVCVTLGTTSVCAQPRISYIIPDIGTTRFASYVEIIAPYNANGAYGVDGVYLNNPGDVVRVVCDRPADTTKVKIGPVVVSWDGRLISTHLFISPLTKPNSPDWQFLTPEFRIPIKVIVNGIVSNIDTFYIVKPWPLGNVALVSERILGQSQLGKRSRRGAMIVDSLLLIGGESYSVSTADCDATRAGNQGLLPFVLLSPTVIRGLGTAEIHADANGIDGGPGGGGGAGGYHNLNTNGKRGTNGGNGFTGGGPGGFSNNGLGIPANEKQKPGTGSGEDLPKNNANTRGSASLNGLPGGESTTSYENAGGGTGHPFGQSGQGCDNRLTCVTSGQYGAGSGSREGRRGGAGGYGEAGASENGFDQGGKIHGNGVLVPLAGGSGGAGGNPDLVNIASAGGGGGGAISIHANLAADFTVYAKGGASSREDILAGCGSGGGAIIGSRLDNIAIGFVSAQVPGGTDPNPNPNPNNRHLPGGLGRRRYEGRVPLDVPVQIGIITDTITNSLRRGTYSGYANGSDLQIYIKPENGPWQIGPVVSGYRAGNSGGWRQAITWPGRDTLYYVAVGQKIASPVAGAYTDEPDVVLSQSAWNIVRIYGPALIDGNKSLNLGLYQCPGEKIRDTVWIRNKGESPLEISSATFNPVPGFRLANPTVFPDTILPFDSTAYVVEFLPVAGQSGVVNTTLRLVNSDTSAGSNPFDISVRVDVEKYDFVYSWRGIQTDTIDIGSICVGREFTDPITIRNIGQSTVRIINFVSRNPAILTVSGTVPFVVPGPLGFTTVNVSFLARGVGLNVTPVLVFLQECPSPDTLWIKHTGVESAMTVIGGGQFGSVRVGDRPELLIEIRNTGTSDLDISSLPPVPAPFRLVSAVPTPPTVIVPGSSMLLTYTYEPNAVGSSSTVFQISSDSTTRSCPSTVEIALSGNAIVSALTASQSSISFGTVSACDSVVDSVVVTNSGGAEITLLYPPFINGPNASSFTIIRQPVTDMILKPGEAATYVVGFYGVLGPDGVKTAILDIRTNDQSVPMVSVPLSGRRFSLDLQGPRVVDLGPVIVGGSASSTKRYTNASAGAINVASMISSFPSRTSALPLSFAVAPSAFQDVTFTCAPAAEGAIEDTVRIVVDQPCADTIIVIVRAVGYSASISAPSMLDLGVVAECQFLRDSITYTNTQSVALDFIDVTLTGQDATAYTIENPGAVTSKTVAPGASQTIYVRFDPRAMTDGVKSSFITLRIRIAGTPVAIVTELKGERRTVLPASPGTIAFGNINLSVRSSQRLVLVNSSAQPVRVTNVRMRGTAASVFSVTSNPSPPTIIAPGASLEITVNFTPTTQQPYSDSVLIDFDQPCTDTRVIPVTGTGRLNVEVLVALPDDTVSPAFEDFRLPIRATVVSGGTDVADGSLKMTIRYASSVFAARTLSTGSILRNEVIGGITELDIVIPSFAVGGTEKVIGEIIGDMTLGSIISTDLKISNASITATNVTPIVRPRDGSLTLAICEQGGPRLIMKSGSLSIIALPNPASEVLELVAEAYERGVHRIDVVTLTGDIVATYSFAHGVDPVPHAFSVNVQALASGTYQIILQTPTRRRVLPLSILH
ncbi:MAG: choice-of-anchor D domain-containing protein [Candidatus Kapabacteria bacterium]|nr:choice-of-anchor D domain-containing protein [Candidatus Kapabacteria bacterium]